MGIGRRKTEIEKKKEKREKSRVGLKPPPAQNNLASIIALSHLRPHVRPYGQPLLHFYVTDVQDRSASPSLAAWLLTNGVHGPVPHASPTRIGLPELLLRSIASNTKSPTECSQITSKPLSPIDPSLASRHKYRTLRPSCLSNAQQLFRWKSTTTTDREREREKIATIFRNSGASSLKPWRRVRSFVGFPCWCS